MNRTPSAEDILALVAGRASEDQVQEFKSATWAANDKGKRECLKDITAFANTRGGMILVGIKEKDNAAHDITPLAADEAEKERGRINDLLQAGVEPRLYGVEISSVAVDGGVVLVVLIPRSSARPHRVTSSSWNKFWLRNSTAAYEANVTDLRNLFLQSADVMERSRIHHRTRIEKIRNGEVVSDIARERGGLFMHIIPSDAFTPTQILDPKLAFQLEREFHPITSPSCSSRYTFEGFMNLRGGSPCYGYTLVSRQGIVEAVKMKLSGGDGVPAFPTESRIILPAFRYSNALSQIGIAPPYYGLVSLLGTDNQQLLRRSDWNDDDLHSQGWLELPPALIESAQTHQQVATAFRPALDAFWNAWGHEGSPSYDDDGNWKKSSNEV